MKKLFIILLLFALTEKTLACDESLQRFERDCKIQDSFRNIREAFARKKVDINHVSIYRATRFIDGASYLAASKKNTPVHQIYSPAPDTWNVWSQGIDRIFASKPKIALNQSNFNLELLSHFHSHLITKELSSYSNNVFAKTGQFRNNSFIYGATFCSADLTKDLAKIQTATQSSKQYQSEWENLYNVKFTAVAKMYKAKKTEKANFAPYMGDAGYACQNGSSIAYEKNKNVESSLTWVRSFINFTLDRHRQGQLETAPIEFAAFAQRWLVSIHPFFDGNGRISRAAQDYLLEFFDLPYAPAGYLQNDATETVDAYFEANYKATEYILQVLSECVNRFEYKKGEDIAYQCRVIDGSL